MNLTKKQQIQVSLIAVFIVILLWQLYKLFSTPAVNMPPVPPAHTNNTSALSYSTGKTPPVPVNDATSKQSSNAPMTKPVASPEVAGLTAPGEEYTRLSSELQIIQMQRAIAESYEAIAVAKRNTAKAMAETAQITGSSIAMPGGTNMDAPHLSNDYELIYTGQEGGQWTATLKKNNQTFDVVPNTVLGNMKVISINDAGVTVAQGDVRKVITFSGIEPADNAEPSPNVDKIIKAPKPIPMPPAPKVNQPTVTTKAVTLQSSALTVTPKDNPVQVHKADTQAVTTVKDTKVTIGQHPSAVNNKPVIQAGPALPHSATTIQQPLKAADKKDLPKPPQVTTNKTPSVVTDDAKVMAINPSHYTIQIMGDSHLINITRFVKNRKLEGKTLIFKTKNNGLDWYVLIYGDYVDFASASKALDELDNGSVTTEPFIRKLSSIQEAIKAYK